MELGEALESVVVFVGVVFAGGPGVSECSSEDEHEEAQADEGEEIGDAAVGIGLSGNRPQRESV